MSTTVSSRQTNRQDQNSLFGEDEENPFKLPSDELIFQFKEMEQNRKAIEREKNKSLKIWEKNRPTREGCLRKITQTDIEPTQLAINPAIQSKVNMAEAAGYTVPIERPKNRENRWKLIEKKREMFLVQQMLEIKRDEIEILNGKAALREDGLTCAENMLESDTKSFLKFFNDIKSKTQEASRALDEKRNEKNKKANELRGITEQIQILTSNISKNLELLEQYNNYKIFLDSLDQSNAKKEEAEQRRREKQKKQAAREQRMHRNEQGRTSQARHGNSKGRQDSIGKDGQTTIENLEQELNIPPSLKEIIDDSDDDLPLIFETTDQLMEILDVKEDENLVLINRCQESEQQLEEIQIKERKEKAELSKAINVLQMNEDTNDRRINKVLAERDALDLLGAGASGAQIEEGTEKELDKCVKELYTIAKGAKQNDEKAEILPMIEDTENILNNMIEEFNLIQNDPKFGDIFFREQREIQNIKRAEKQEKKKGDLEKARLEQARIRQEQKDNKKIKKIGKPLMVRLEAQKVKKQEVKKKVRTEEEEMYFKYMGLELNES